LYNRVQASESGKWRIESGQWKAEIRKQSKPGSTLDFLTSELSNPGIPGPLFPALSPKGRGGVKKVCL